AGGRGECSRPRPPPGPGLPGQSSGSLPGGPPRGATSCLHFTPPELRVRGSVPRGPAESARPCGNPAGQKKIANDMPRDGPPATKAKDPSGSGETGQLARRRAAPAGG